MNEKLEPSYVANPEDCNGCGKESAFDCDTCYNRCNYEPKDPIQEFCTICNKISKKLELANISGKYRKDINDYIWLCCDCHQLFDKINKTHV